MRFAHIHSFCEQCLTTGWAGLAVGEGGGGVLSEPLRWPSVQQLLRVLTLRDHNTRVVLLGTAFLGLASGIIGTFMLLRKRALLGDMLSHATLPGIGVAFMVMTALGGEGKHLPGLLLGAVFSCLLGVGWFLLIRNYTKVKDDAALGVVLSVLFGLGTAILGVIAGTSEGNQAGLNSFIFGKTASMLASDASLMVIAAVGVALLCGLLHKEFGLVCFDPSYAGSQGWPVGWLDVVMMGLVVAVTVIGLQAVGLILIVAMLIIPAAAARFWTERLGTMVVIAGVIGAACGLFGAALSALMAKLPTGAVIVVVTAGVFVVSLVFGPRRGALARLIGQQRRDRKIRRQHLLRAMYECTEAAWSGPTDRKAKPIPIWELTRARSWGRPELTKLLNRAMRRGLVATAGEDGYRLTASGLSAATRVMRNHRLWEMYLITHADIAPSHVDRDADQIEHVLDPEMIEELESLVTAGPETVVPPSPHKITWPTADDPYQEDGSGT